jgi:AcrR family transcriptional regulator
MREDAIPAKRDARERICDAAFKSFANFGYRGVSTRQIALEAGVNEVTLFRHYPRKRDLYLAVLESELVRLTLRGDLLTRLASARDGHSALQCAYRLIEATLGENPDLLRLLQYSTLEGSAEVDQLLRNHLHELIELIAGYLTPWIDKGELGGTDAKSLVFTLTTIILSENSFRRIFGDASRGSAAALATCLHEGVLLESDG